MELSVEATYEDGVLKPAESLPLAEHEKVHITVHPSRPAEDSEATIPCTDQRLIEWAATAPELESPMSGDDL